MGYLEPKTMEKFKKPQKWVIIGLVAPKWGLVGSPKGQGGAENGFKNCKKKFCENCENFKSIGTGVAKLSKISF